MGEIPSVSIGEDGRSVVVSYYRTSAGSLLIDIEARCNGLEYFLPVVTMEILNEIDNGS